MPSLVVMNDPHYSRREPECRAPTYPREILDKFHAAARAAKKIGAALACTGDWFHRKGQVTFSEVNDVLAVLSSWKGQGIDVLGILGNHDISGQDLANSMDTRAAGAMVHSRVLHLLDREPWVKSDKHGTIHVTGSSYFHGCDRDDESRIRMYGAERPEDPDAVHVHLAHGCLLQEGTFFEEYTVAEDLITILDQANRLPDVIICGHLHFPQGVREYPRPSGTGTVTVCRIGSLGRVSSDDMVRIPAVLVLAIKGRKVITRELPVGKPAQAVNRAVDGPRGPEEYQERIQTFVSQLREQADQESLEDHATLLREITTRKGYSQAVYELALERVNARS